MSAIKFKVVVFNDGCFVANTEVYPSYNSQIPNLLFDGVKAIQSCKKHWYKLDKVPTSITKMSSDSITINHRYELKDSIKFDLPKVYKR